MVLDLHGRTVLPGFADLSARIWNDDATLDEKACQALLNGGVVATQSACPAEWAPELLARLRDPDFAARVPFRYLPSFVTATTDDVRSVASACLSSPCAAPVSVRIVLDGVLEDRSAALLHDYSDADGVRGELLLSENELERLCVEAANAGLGVDVKASGDAAADVALNVFGRMLQKKTARGAFRISGCVCMRHDQATRAAELGIGAEIAPQRVGELRDILLSRLGSERARLACAWQTLLKHGVTVGGGSFGNPRVTPLVGMQLAMTRRDLDGCHKVSWVPTEALGRADAFWLYTGGAFRVWGLPEGFGTLRPGMPADMVVLMQNPFLVAHEALPNVEIGMTIVAGEIKKIV